jgi:hypothetical protein
VIAPLGKIGNAFDQAPHAWFGFPVLVAPGNLAEIYTEFTEALRAQRCWNN